MADLTILTDDNTTTNIVYIGWARPGTATSSAFWKICKLTYTATANAPNVYWANGSDEFDKEWDNRATYTYNA